MITPEITVKLIESNLWGLKAMERRVLKCCAANPNCPIGERCNASYDRFQDRRDAHNANRMRGRLVKQWPSYQKTKDQRSANYHRLRAHGVNSAVATRNSSNRATERLLAGMGVAPLTP